MQLSVRTREINVMTFLCFRWKVITDNIEDDFLQETHQWAMLFFQIKAVHVQLPCNILLLK